MPITLFVTNAQHLTDKSGLRKTVMEELIRAYNPDILSLSEVGANLSFGEFRQLGMANTLSTTHKTRGKWTASGQRRLTVAGKATQLNLMVLQHEDSLIPASDATALRQAPDQPRATLKFSFQEAGRWHPVYSQHSKAKTQDAVRALEATAERATGGIVLGDHNVSVNHPAVQQMLTANPHLAIYVPVDEHGRPRDFTHSGGEIYDYVVYDRTKYFVRGTGLSIDSFNVLQRREPVSYSFRAGVRSEVFKSRASDHFAYAVEIGVVPVVHPIGPMLLPLPIPPAPVSIAPPPPPPPPAPPLLPAIPRPLPIPPLALALPAPVLPHSSSVASSSASAAGPATRTRSKRRLDAPVAHVHNPAALRRRLAPVPHPPAAAQHAVAASNKRQKRSASPPPAAAPVGLGRFSSHAAPRAGRSPVPKPHMSAFKPHSNR